MATQSELAADLEGMAGNLREHLADLPKVYGYPRLDDRISELAQSVDELAQTLRATEPR